MFKRTEQELSLSYHFKSLENWFKATLIMPTHNDYKARPVHSLLR